MNLISFFFVTLLYAIAVFMFGVYVRLIEFVDLFDCFMCKEFKEMRELQASYDYIVVGCGSAGSVAALRLAEDKHTSVLVLEAGPHGGRWFDIPAIAPLLQSTSVDWQYQTEPQENAAKGLSNQKSNWPRGRIVGGSGRLNHLVYLRGHPSDFHEWYKDLPDFNYETDILTYFKKTENHQGSYKNDTKYHSTRGPVTVEDLSFVTPLAKIFLEAVEMLGYPIRDLNGEFNTGFMQSQVNTASGTRWTPMHHIYALPKPNLHLQTNTEVHRVLLRFGYEAHAVEYSYLGEKLTMRARKGIILSAGVIGTPKILMLSGIGPKDHLSDVGIETKVNLPVGNNLLDHVTTGLDLVLLNTTLGVDVTTLLSPGVLFDYFYSSSGPLTSAFCDIVGAVDTNSKTYCHGFLDSLKSASISRIKSHKGETSKVMKMKRTKCKAWCLLDKHLPAAQRYKSSKIIVGDPKYSVANEVCPIDDSRQPDLGFMVMPLGASVDGGKHFRKILGIEDTVWKSYFASLSGQSVITILPIVLHPKSKGTVRLKNKNVYSQPVINPNYLSDPYDVEILLKGIDLIKKIIETKPMRGLGAKLNEQKFPGCEDLEFDTKWYWECYVRHLTVTAYHPGGTCKIGIDPNESVVGYDFRVHNTNKLYVADASVMATLPSGNPNAAVMMIGEKVAAEIKYYNSVIRHHCRRREIFLCTRICLG